MFIYEWNNDYHKNPLIIKQVTACNNEGKTIIQIIFFKYIFKKSIKGTGIDKLYNPTQENIDLKFSGCLNKTYGLIPDERKNRTKISLLATAGMRLFR